MLAHDITARQTNIHQSMKPKVGIAGLDIGKQVEFRITLIYNLESIMISREGS